MHTPRYVKKTEINASITLRPSIQRAHHPTSLQGKNIHLGGVDGDTDRTTNGPSLIQSHMHLSLSLPPR